MSSINWTHARPASTHQASKLYQCSLLALLLPATASESLTCAANVQHGLKQCAMPQLQPSINQRYSMVVRWSATHPGTAGSRGEARATVNTVQSLMLCQERCHHSSHPINQLPVAQRLPGQLRVSSGTMNQHLLAAAPVQPFRCTTGCLLAVLLSAVLLSAGQLPISRRHPSWSCESCPATPADSSPAARHGELSELALNSSAVHCRWCTATQHTCQGILVKPR